MKVERRSMCEKVNEINIYASGNLYFFFLCISASLFHSFFVYTFMLFLISQTIKENIIPFSASIMINSIPLISASFNLTRKFINHSFFFPHMKSLTFQSVIILPFFILFFTLLLLLLIFLFSSPHILFSLI